MKVLYEDNHLLVVEKPVNVPTQADRSKDLDLLSMAKSYIKEKYQKPGNVFLALVHRLDRPVGGCLVFAKTSKAASRLSNELRLNRFDRVYYAVVHGHLEKSSGQLLDYLYKDREKNISYVVDKNHDQAKKAILHYKVLDQSDHLSLVKVELETGRSHQIRFQLAHLGHPLYGDQKYGQAYNKPGQQIALWAYLLGFKHPTKDEKIQVTSLPEDQYPWNLFT